MRLKIASKTKSQDWSIQNLIDVCVSLKNSKACDNEGLIFELFKPKYCGEDVLVSLTQLFNQIKSSLTIPDFFQQMKQMKSQ